MPQRLLEHAEERLAIDLTVEGSECDDMQVKQKRQQILATTKPREVIDLTREPEVIDLTVGPEEE